MPKHDLRYYVTFKSDNGLAVTVLLDEPTPYPTSGFGGWEIIDRPKRVGMTRFKGKPPFKQDVAVIFDGVIDNESQEPFISRLARMASQPDARSEPPKITISGTVLRKDLTYVIEDLTFDNQNTIWDVFNGTPVRIRQHVIVHLLQFVDDTVLTTAASPAVTAKTSTQHNVTVPSGMTIKQVAAIELGDPNKYELILIANPWLNPDPRAIIPAGTTLTIPGHIGTFKVPG